MTEKIPGDSRLTRRSLLLTGAAAGLLGAPALARGEELRFKHVYGEAVLPKPAERVVSIGYTTQDPILALGVKPLAVREWFGGRPYAVWPWAEPLLGEAQPQVLTAESSPEIIAGLQPDLILAMGSGISKSEYRLLSRIAPVLMQPSGVDRYGMRWDEMTLLTGRALGREAQAEDLVAGVKAEFADLRERRPDWKGKTAAAAYSFGGDVGAFVGEDSRAAFLTELGFVPPPNLSGGWFKSFYSGLSPEKLTPLEGDLLIWVTEDSRAAEIAAMPMRKKLKVHLEGREIFAGDLLSGALSFGSVLSLPLALKALEPEILAALDGDPRTPVPSAVEAGLAP